MSARMPGPLGVPEVWDVIADGYSQDVAPFFARYAEEALRLLPVDSSSRVLDVASGPGTLAFLAAERGARVSAVDFSPGMIEVLRKSAAREGVTNVDAQVMDAQLLGFSDSTFAAAYCLFAFMFFPDRARVFREIRRVLKVGGRALVATWSPIERRPLLKIGFDAMAEAIPHMPPMPKGDLQSPEECIEEMTAAGFRDVETHLFTASMRVESPEHFLQTMERSGAGFAMVRKRAGDAWPRLQERLIDALARRLPSGGIELPSEAILSIGSR